MKVLIVGAGNMGRGIATRLAAAKAKLTIYDIDAAKAQAIAPKSVARSRAARAMPRRKAT